MRNVLVKVLAICVILFCLIGCNKSKPTTSTNSVEATSTSEKAAIKQKEPIIIDWKDFEFTKGYNVPGTIFQANFLWSSQDGKEVWLSNEDGSGWPESFSNAPQRYDFKQGDPVTVVFRVALVLGDLIYNDIVSISPRQ